MSVRLRSVSIPRARRAPKDQSIDASEPAEAPLPPGRDAPEHEEPDENSRRVRPRYTPKAGEPAPPLQAAAPPDASRTGAPPPGLERPMDTDRHDAPEVGAKGKGKQRAPLYIQTEANPSDNPWSTMTDEPPQDYDVAAGRDNGYPTRSSTPPWYVPPCAGRDMPWSTTGAAASSSRSSRAHDGEQRNYTTRWDGSWRAENHHAWREWSERRDARHHRE